MERTATAKGPGTVRKHAHLPPSMDAQLFVSLFNNPHLCILVIDPESARIVNANPCALHFYGHTKNELARLTVAALSADIPESPAPCPRGMRVLQGEGGKYRHRLKNGEVRDIEMCCGTVMLGGQRRICAIVSVRSLDRQGQDEAASCERKYRPPVERAGECAGGTAIVSDAVSSREKEAQLRESESRYRAIFEMSSTAMMIVDRDHAIQLANSKFMEYFGYNPAALQVKPDLYSIISADDVARVKEYHRLRMNHDPRVPREYECRYIDKHGDVRHMIVNVSLIDDTGQSIIALLDITDRRQMEEKLRENEERFRLLIENVKDHAVFMLTPEGTIGSWNDGAERISGYRKEDVLGKNLACFYTQETAKFHQYGDLLSAARHGQAEWSGWWVKKDGAWFWAHVAVAGLFNNEGMMRGYSVMLQDITENKRTEELLREREELYRTLIETSPEAIVLFDTKSRILMVNQQAAILFGYEHTEDGFGESIFNFIVPEDRQRMKDGIAQLQYKISRNKLYTFIKKDGTRFVASISASTIFDADKKPKFYIGMVADVTEQRKIEVRMRNAAEEWRTTFDSLKDFVFITDRDMNITRVNKACAAAYRTKPKELVGKRCFEVFRHLRAMSARGQYDKVLRHRKNISEELHDPMLGQHQEVTISPIVNETGDFIGTVHVVKDVTEKKRINDILRSEKEAIERLAIERTKELISARIKLEQAKRLSDIGTLAATVAHELRNPLGVIRTAAYNIKRKNQNEALKGHLANIEKKILESDQIISNLLFYTRIKTPNYEKVRVCELLESCIDSARDRFHRWEVVIEGQCEEIVDGYIMADPLQITELFDNIINNAYESFPEKKGKIGIRGGYDGGGNMWISIGDNGIGIDQADLERITEPFFTKKSKGTGLGLTVCRQIAELHDGKLYIDSQKGTGTTVTVSLPVTPSRLFEGLTETLDDRGHGSLGTKHTDQKE